MSINTLHEKAELQHDKISQEIFEVLSADIDNLENLKNIVKKEALGLKNVLGDDTLVVSSKTRKLIENIKDKKLGKKKGSLYKELEKVKGEQNKIATANNNTYGKEAKNKAAKNETALQAVITSLGEGEGSRNKKRYEEYEALLNCIDLFKGIDEKECIIKDIKTDEDKEAPIKVFNTTTLGSEFSQKTTLLNLDGSEIQQIKDDKYKIKLKNKEGNLQEYVFDKMELKQESDGSEIKLQFSEGFKIYKSDGKTVADDLNLNDIEFGIETAVSHTGLKQKVAKRQTLKLELELPVGKNDRIDRIKDMQGEIENNLEAIYTSSFKNIQKEAIEQVIKSWGLQEYDSLNDNEKAECIKLLSFKILKSEMTDFDAFGEFMKGKTDDMSYRYSEADYRSYLASNIQKNIKDFMANEVKKTIDKQEDKHKASVINFLGNLEKSKTDNADQRKQASNFMDKHINTLIKDMRKKNYMKFYSNEAYQLKGQKVQINGSEGKEVNYDMELKVLSPTSFVLELAIDGVKLPAKSSDSYFGLIESILGDYDVRSDKTRLHIAYNIYKSMLGIAQKRGLKLTRKEGKKHRRTLALENNNIRATNWELRDDRTSDYGNLFDEKEFQASSNMEDYTKGLKHLATEFHTLNKSERDKHRETTKRKWLFARNKTKTKLPARWFFSPVKFLLNKNRNLNFDFDTTLNIPSIGEGSEEKNISISFKKNKFVIGDGEKTFSSFNPAKILRKPQFETHDRRIWAEIYKNLIAKLRTNTTIKNRSYYAYDETTDRTYIINANGQIGYVADEDTTMGKKSIFGKKRKNGDRRKSCGVINGHVHAMKILDNPDELYQDPYLMGNIIKTMNTSLRTGTFKDLLPDWMKSQKLKRAA